MIDPAHPPPLPPPQDELEWSGEAASIVERVVVGAVVVFGMVLYLAALAGLIVMAAGAANTASAAEPPAAAQHYQRDLTREARAVWGMDAAVPVMAAQIAQESSWRDDAESPYAQGLAQFTPGTADWISDIYPTLGAPSVWNPQWAIRALVRYDRYIWQRQAADAATECDQWAFTLSGYNGGPGWVNRDRRQCERAAGGKPPPCGSCDPARWWGHVAEHPDPRRADWAVRENRDYPRRILLERQAVYRHWGPVVACEAAH